MLVLRIDPNPQVNESEKTTVEAMVYVSTSMSNTSFSHKSFVFARVNQSTFKCEVTGREDFFAPFIVTAALETSMEILSVMFLLRRGEVR